jgi:hypothetical protein
MRKELKWALVGAVALALQAGTAAAVEATDAAPSAQVSGATTNPAHQECQQPNLSPQAKARCDFIASTPNLCQRSGLSKETQQFCDQLAGAPALPKECQRPNLSPEAQARCDFIAHTPNLCQRSNLSKNTQLFCDQQRFAGEPLYNVVRVAANGAVRSIHLIETANGREVYTGYPYGIAFAVPDPRDRELRMKVEDLGTFLDGRPTPAAAESSAPSGYATGRPIGWNPSTGITSDQCFNYTIATPSNNINVQTFTSQNAASSTSQQINVSTTVSGAYDAFQASDTFSYSDQWQSSANSSNNYFNAYSLYTLASTVDSTTPLNTNGTGALANGTFDTACGSEYLETVPVGMVVTISINYGSSSSSTQTDISNQFKASYGLESISNAVSTANSHSDSSSYFTFSMMSYGGGKGPTADLNTAFAATDPTTNEAYYAECAAGDTGGCANFQTSMGSGASQALTSFNNEVSALSGATNPDISFFAAFPGGVAGADTSEPVPGSIPQNATNDVLKPYAAELNQYLKLVNQIVTLSNRVSTYATVTSSLYNKVQQGDFNPSSFLNVTSYLEPLAKTYQDDRATLLSNLQACLIATEDNVTSVCGPIINNTIDNAYDWYDTGGGNANFAAQQNAIALQYAGLFTNNNGSSWPQDVFYAFELPAWSDVNEFFLIGGKAGLVSFADTPYVNAGTTETAASLTFLPLELNADLSDLTTSVFTTEGTTPPGLWFSWFDAGPGPATNDADEPLQWLGLTNICQPSFSDPCPIGYGLQDGQPDYPLSIQMTQIPNFFTAE